MLTDFSHEYNEFGATVLQRKKEIDDKTSKSKKYYSLPFMGKVKDLPIIEVRINFPVYRLKNGRTRTFQLEYLAKHPESPSDLFTKDHDSYAAQAAQHQILLDLAEEADLLKAFRDEGLEQTEPIICTDDGIVVNGNRRLCTWRELYYSNKEKYKRFETIMLAILPPCDEKAVSDLEKQLQIQNTMKAPYRWHTIALMAKEDLAKGLKDSAVAKSYGMSTQALHLTVDSIDYAIQYLEHIGKPEYWSLVDKAELAFNQMVKCRKQLLKTTEEKAAFESLCFMYIKTGSDEGRLYEKFPDIAKNFEQIVERVREKLPVESETPEKEIDEAFNLLEGEEDTQADSLSQFAVAIKNSDDPEMIKKTVRQVLDTQKQMQIDRDAENYLLDKLSRIASQLQEIITNGLNDDRVKIDGVQNQIEAIEAKITSIKAWLATKQ